LFSSSQEIRTKLKAIIVLLFNKTIVDTFDSESLEEKLIKALIKSYFERGAVDEYFELLEEILVSFGVNVASMFTADIFCYRKFGASIKSYKRHLNGIEEI